MAHTDDGQEAALEPTRRAYDQPDSVQPALPMGHESGPVVGVSDGRLVAAYLVALGAQDYIAVMDVLEASVTDMTPADVVVALSATGHRLDEKVVVTRRDQLHSWGNVSARTDSSRVLRYQDIVSKNWRYTATPQGRKMHRFFRNVLSGEPMVREIPLTNLARLVDALEQLAGISGQPPAVEHAAEVVSQAFTAHDDLDGALVGAEDALAGLADRFDLDGDKAGELKTLLVDYATHVAIELRRGSARAARALQLLTPEFAVLAERAIDASSARELITSGALTASRGGRVEDWLGLVAWCAPERGRAQRFALRLVRALPGMHVNLRRLHTSTGTATSRARALSLAKACYQSELAPSLFLASLGDHSWRKLHGGADDDELTRVPSWRAGPTVAVPDLLRLTGRSGARGRPAAPRDDSAARADVERRRRERQQLHEQALMEVLTAPSGAVLSQPAARLAMSALMAAARTGAAGPRRSASCDGLTCTLFHSPGSTGALLAPTWQVWLPSRIAVFHQQGAKASEPATVLVADTDSRALLVVEGAA